VLGPFPKFKERKLAPGACCTTAFVFDGGSLLSGMACWGHSRPCDLSLICLSGKIPAYGRSTYDFVIDQALKPV
jgi:hypothetical protein